MVCIEELGNGSPFQIWKKLVLICYKLQILIIYKCWGTFIPLLKQWRAMERGDKFHVCHRSGKGFSLKIYAKPYIFWLPYYLQGESVFVQLMLTNCYRESHLNMGDLTKWKYSPSHHCPRWAIPSQVSITPSGGTGLKLFVNPYYQFVLLSTALGDGILWKGEGKVVSGMHNSFTQCLWIEPSHTGCSTCKECWEIYYLSGKLVLSNITKENVIPCRKLPWRASHFDCVSSLPPSFPPSIWLFVLRITK